MRPRGQVASRWQTDWLGLALDPDPGDLDREHQTVVGFGPHELADPGWAAVGIDARQSYELPAAADRVHRYYLPDHRAQLWTLKTWGQAPTATATTLVAVGPTVRATMLRQPGQAGAAPGLAHPLVLALHLANTAAGRAALETWRPPPALVPACPWEPRHT